MLADRGEEASKGKLYESRSIISRAPKASAENPRREAKMRLLAEVGTNLTSMAHMNHVHAKAHAASGENTKKSENADADTDSESGTDSNEEEEKGPVEDPKLPKLRTYIGSISYHYGASTNVFGELGMISSENMKLCVVAEVHSKFLVFEKNLFAPIIDDIYKSMDRDLAFLRRYVTLIFFALLSTSRHKALYFLL